MIFSTADKYGQITFVKILTYFKIKMVFKLSTVHHLKIEYVFSFTGNVAVYRQIIINANFYLKAIKAGFHVKKLENIDKQTWNSLFSVRVIKSVIL